MSNIKLYAFADEASKQMGGQIAAMLRNGLDGLEIRGVDGTNVSCISLKKAKKVRKMMDDNGLHVWSIGSPIGKIRLDEDFQAHLECYRHTLDVADILGSENIRLFSFYMPKEEDPALYRQQVIDRIGQILEIGRGTGINICHENEKGIYGDTADRCLDLHQSMPELKGVFDPANYVQCGEDTLRAWEMLKNYIHYLHIKDALPDGSVVPAGKGHGNIAAIIKRYLTQGGTAMTLEPHLTIFDGLKELEQSGNASGVGSRYVYPSNDAAFDAAVAALKEILQEVKICK